MEFLFISLFVLELILFGVFLVAPIIIGICLLKRKHYKSGAAILAIYAICIGLLTYDFLWLTLDPHVWFAFFPYLIVGGLLWILAENYAHFKCSAKTAHIVRVVAGSLALIVLILIAPLVSGKNAALVALGDESDSYAESAYGYLQRTASVDWLVGELNRQDFVDINVKFYLARMLGHDLRTMDPSAKAKILASLSHAKIETVFFAANSVNQNIGCTTPVLSPRGVAEYYSNQPD